MPSDSPLPDEAWLNALSSLPDMGPARLRALLADRQPEQAWKVCLQGKPLPEVEAVVGGRLLALTAAWAKAAGQLSVGELWSQLTNHGVQVIGRGHAEYPACLRDDPDPPLVIFAQGDLQALAPAPRVAIVGTRRCTRYGTEVAYELGKTLTAAGVSVVSGLALGIDAAAHAGALAVKAEGQPPVAVVATGLDVIYPKTNRALWRQIAERGLLVSECPLGTTPAPWRFPARNRIIAGLADAVVVVESHEKGGSLYTVDAAIERQRPVFAIPGPIRSPASRGTNQLLADGAIPLCQVSDLLEQLPQGGLFIDEPPPPPVRALLAPQQEQVLEAMGWEPVSLNALADCCGLSPVDLSAALSALVRSGWVTVERGFYERMSNTT
ncbi:MAG: DNA-processing protein DprA [Acidimicrobiales bacterium]|nr:DNA-processing protein DprA [Acidimicrobiales bacterium]